MYVITYTPGCAAKIGSGNARRGLDGQCRSDGARRRDGGRDTGEERGRQTHRGAARCRASSPGLALPLGARRISEAQAPAAFSFFADIGVFTGGPAPRGPLVGTLRFADWTVLGSPRAVLAEIAFERPAGVTVVEQPAYDAQPGRGRMIEYGQMFVWPRALPRWLWSRSVVINAIAVDGETALQLVAVDDWAAPVGSSPPDDIGF
jgi:hypothetical protein